MILSQFPTNNHPIRDMAQQPSSSSSALFPPIESAIAALDQSDKYLQMITIEKKLITHLKNVDPLKDIRDRASLPAELLSDTKKTAKPQVNPLERLKKLSTEEVEDEEETENEEEEDEEAAVEDEEDDAGGDYLVSHFDNGEGYEDNDDDGDDVTGTIN